jgi:hypothetical protein
MAAEGLLYRICITVHLSNGEPKPIINFEPHNNEKSKDIFK